MTGETREQVLERWEKWGITDPTCPTCRATYYDNPAHPLLVQVMGPRHRASPKCESGGKPHCSCDVCF